jgi:hypothetical protein
MKSGRESVRTFIIIALMVALLPAAAYAQAARPSKGPLTERTDDEKKNDEAIDKAYQEQLKNPQFSKQSAKSSSDPWGSIRPADSDTTKR